MKRILASLICLVLFFSAVADDIVIDVEIPTRLYGYLEACAAVGLEFESTRMPEVYTSDALDFAVLQGDNFWLSYSRNMDKEINMNLLVYHEWEPWCYITAFEVYAGVDRAEAAALYCDLMLYGKVERGSVTAEIEDRNGFHVLKLGVYLV